MSNAYGYQNSFDDFLAREFRRILSLDTSIKEPPILSLWLDASDASTIVKDEHDNLSKWTDKSDFKNDFIQPDRAKQPLYVKDGLNQKATIYSDGDQKIIELNHDIDIGQAYTAFTVLQHDIDNQIDDNPLLPVETHYSPEFYDDGKAALCSTIYDGLYLYHYVNFDLVGIETRDPANAEISDIYLFGNGTHPASLAFIGWVSEVKLFTHTLDTASHLSHSTELINKWNILL